ncbi:MAG: fatty acid desaturase [Polyangiaceae bacterium]|nr:fatty acid desaturase [Polyangiaceae bacterium]MCL4755370.1 fatty acid desaturase [Myxococcales bacterium]
MAMLAEWWLEPSESRTRSLFRHSARDAWLVGVTLAQTLATLAAFALLPPLGAALSFAVGICWCSNTVSHNHLHNPLFRSRRGNRALDLWLSLLLGVPQTIWKARHVWHHAGEPARTRRPLSRAAKREIALIGVLWLGLALLAPRVFLLAYVPGYLLGMALCRLQGDMEHARREAPEAGVSHYGRVYNFFWFNDGYHAEHHRFPREHWTRLPERRSAIALSPSDFPPHLRWLELLPRSGAELRGALLCALERLALSSAWLQRFMLASHARAIAPLLRALPERPRRVAIVGGGLFPRSLLVLAELLPEARFVVVDRSAESVSRAVDHLKRRGFELSRVRFCIESFDPQEHCRHDLVVAPLAFVGERDLLAEAEQRAAVLRHDWVWARPSGVSRVVSWLLLKRVSLRLPA